MGTLCLGALSELLQALVRGVAVALRGKLWQVVSGDVLKAPLGGTSYINFDIIHESNILIIE